MTQAVASGHRMTTDTAMDVLLAGGTAVDACIAAAFTAFVAEPVLAQPLGGGFLMVLPKGGTPVLMDAFIQTPRQKPAEADLDLRTVTVDFGTTTQDFHIGAGTTGTPCLMQGLWEAHARLGRIPLRDLAEPATRLAREGCALTAFQANVASIVGPILTATESIRALYCNEDALLGLGAVFRNPDLADALETAAIEGPRLFADGEIGRALLSMQGTALSAEDLRRAEPRWRAPLSISRAGVEVHLNPPPSLGGVQIALALLALPGTPDAAQIASAMLAINEVRRAARIDDAPSEARRILDPDLVEQVRRISQTRRVAQRGTTHISVVDSFGTGAALTLSNGEGNGQILPGTGIHPNNMLGEEDLVPDGPTAWPENQRLASMMCPMCLRDGVGGITVLGSGGSNRIRSALTTVTLNLIDAGMPLADAVDAPRMHVEGTRLDFEAQDDAARRELLLTHFTEATAWPETSLFFGGVHAARLDARGDVSAVGDPRRAGYGATA